MGLPCISISSDGKYTYFRLVQIPGEACDRSPNMNIRLLLLDVDSVILVETCKS